MATKKISNAGPTQDPFYVVKEEVTQSMEGITALYNRWKDLLSTTNTSQSEEFKWTTNELKTGLKSIEYDLTDLEDTVSVVENNRTKFKIDESEITTRKGFITATKQKVNSIKEDLNSPKTKSKLERDQREILVTQKQGSDKYSKLQVALEQDNDDFINDQGQRQQQIIRQQDQDLTVLHETVGTLKQMGQQMDITIKEHEELIEELNTDVDKVDTGLKGAIQRVNKLIDTTKDSTQWCIIAFLFVALIALVVLLLILPSKSKVDSSSTTTTTS